MQLSLLSLPSTYSCRLIELEPKATTTASLSLCAVYKIFILVLEKKRQFKKKEKKNEKEGKAKIVRSDLEFK
jgi:hypothetical protein